MLEKIKYFRLKVIISTALVVLLAGLLITYYNYRLTNYIVLSGQQVNLDIFTGRILTEIEHLDVTLETTIQIMNDEHISIAKAVDYILQDATEEELSPEALQRLADPLDILELNLADANGILTHSNVPELIGFNYNDYESTRIYITLATRTLTEIREEPRQSVLDENEFGATNHYAGIPRTGGGFIQLGFDAAIIWRLYEEFSTAQAIRDIEIGNNGYGMVMTDGIITAHPVSTMLGTDVRDEEWFHAVNSGYGTIWLELDGTLYYTNYKNEDHHTVVGLVPESELFRDLRDILFRSLTLTFISVIVIIPLVYMLTDRLLNADEKATGKKDKALS